MSRTHARVAIDGHIYSIGCEGGDEGRIETLAGELDQTIAALKTRLGDIGEHRLAVMAALTALDRLATVEAANARLRERIDVLERAREAYALAADADDAPLVARLTVIAKRIDKLAGALNSDTRALTKPAAVPVAPAAPVLPRTDETKPEPADAPAGQTGRAEADAAPDAPTPNVTPTADLDVSPATLRA
ncbi:MAG: cell division protein ZapA [Pseudomonadota bacterium]